MCIFVVETLHVTSLRFDIFLQNISVTPISEVKFLNLNLYPQDKIARAVARSISAKMHSGFQDLRQNMPMNCRAVLPGKGMTPDVQKDIERITKIWRQLREQFFKEGNMLFGKFTIADAMYAPVLLRCCCCCYL